MALRLAIVLSALLTLGTAADAQNLGARLLNSNLAVSAKPAPQLPTCASITIAIGTGSGGATVTNGGSGAFSVSFGNVNGLGIGTPASGVSVSTSPSGATYTTPITVTPTFLVCLPLGVTQTVSVYQNATTSSASQTSAREGGNAGSVVSVPNLQASATTITSSPVSGAAITRYVGVFVSNTNGGSRVTGVLAPKFVYEFKLN